MVATVPRVRERLTSVYRQIRDALGVVRSPTRLLRLFGGNAMAELTFASVLGLSLLAYGETALGTGVGDDYRIIYLDTASNKVVMVEQPGISPMTQAPVTQKVYIDSYMEAGGFNMPQTMRIM